MTLLLDEVYHVMAEGNHGQTLFFTDAEYRFFLGHFERFIRPICLVRAGVLLPNQVHVVVQTTPESVAAFRHGSLTLQALTNGFRVLLSSYSAWQNARYKQTGSWFRQRTQYIRLAEEENWVQKEVWLRKLPENLEKADGCREWPYWVEPTLPQPTRSEVRSPQTRVGEPDEIQDRNGQGPDVESPATLPYWPTKYPPYPIPGYQSHPWLRVLTAAQV